MDHLIVFAREPIVGRVKTRLARTVGDEAARDLHLAFLEDTLALAPPATRRILAVAGDPAQPDLARLADRRGFVRVAQPEGDLGARMAALLSQFAPACIIGSDSPTLPRGILEEALGAHEVVIGPSRDGGYYLIGMQRLIPEIFSGMQWSTPTVLAETLRRLHGRAVHLLPAHYDVDDEDDLALLREELGRLPDEIAAATRCVLARLTV